jgi:hypothetical protein
MCGFISEGMAIPLGPGDHLIRVRISGRIRIEGGPSCNAFGATNFGPLGVPNPTIPSLPFMRTSVSWGGQVYRGGVIGIFRYHPLLSYYANHENNCKLVGNPVMEVFVRDKVDEQPRLLLTCEDDDGPLGPANPSMVRGTELFCEVEARPSGTVQPTGWRFDGMAGIVIRRPADEAGETQWSGRMIVSGTITVEGKVNGRVVAPATVAVAVGARNWDGVLQYPSQPEPRFAGAPRFPYPPIVKAGDGVTDQLFGLTEAAQLNYVLGSADGPNAAIEYIVKPSFSRLPTITLNRALDPTDPVFRAQQGGRSDGSRYVQCDQAFMHHALRFVTAHEIRHYEIDKAFFEERATAQFLEALYSYNPAGVTPLDTTATTPLLAALKARQDAWDRENNLAIPCEFQDVRADR